jgi:hypothetical protein
MKPQHVWLLAALLLGLGCSAPVAYYQCDDLVGRVELDARTVWDCNRDVMRRVARGKKFSLREFRSAAEFFEDLTGIPADTRDTRQGTQPGPGVRDDLKRWDAWYRDHRDSLVWDDKTGSVRLAAGSAS